MPYNDMHTHTLKDKLTHERAEKRLHFIKQKENMSLADLLEMNWLCPEEITDHAIENKLRDTIHEVVEKSCYRMDQTWIKVEML